MSAANWGIFGGGAKYLFSGPKRPSSKLKVERVCSLRPEVGSRFLHSMAKAFCSIAPATLCDGMEKDCCAHLRIAPPFIGDRDRGGVKKYRMLEGGGNSPRKLPVEDLDF